MKKTVETIKKQWMDASYQELHQVARQQVKLYMEELNVLYQQQLFEIADVQYDLRAKVILKMRAEQKAEAEAWLTENLNQQIELEQEGTESAEVAL